LSSQFEEDEMDTDEIILQRIGVDTQTATDSILRTREDIQNIQDAVVGDTETEIDIVSEATVLKENIELARKDVGQLKIDIDQFQLNQKQRYEALMKKELAEEAEQKRKELEEDNRRKNEEDIIAVENARRLKEDQQQRMRELGDEQDENEKRRKQAELKSLRDELDREAEENRLRQKQEIMNILEGDNVEILKMKDQVLVLVDKQEKIGHIRRKRRELYTIPEDEETRDELEMNGLVEKTAELYNALLSNEKQMYKLKDDVKQKDYKELMNDVMYVETDVTIQSKTLKNISIDTDDIYKKHELMLNEGLKQRGMDTKKQELLNYLDEDIVKLNKIKTEIKNVRSSQENIGNIIDQRRKIFPVGKEKEMSDDAELNSLMERTSKLYDSTQKMCMDISNMEAEIESTDPVILLTHLTTAKREIEAISEILTALKEDTNKCLEIHEKLFKQGIKQKDDEEKAKKQMQEDADSLNKLKNDAENIAVKQMDLEAELKRTCKEDEVEKGRRLTELEKLKQQQNELSNIEKSLDETSEKYEEWKDFQWTEAEESELIKYGMISSLAMPSFPLGLIKDPALLAAIQKRHAELLDLRKSLKKDAMRMQEICEALEEMERRQREAELRRICEQSKEWIKDFVPSGPAEFGTEPVFRSDFHMDPEEARARAASRKASRLQSRESSVTPLEDIGAARGYDDILLGYTARSRQQSLDRRSGSVEDGKRDPEANGPSGGQRRSRRQEKEVPSPKIEPTAVGLEENLRKPPTAPRRKRDKLNIA